MDIREYFTQRYASPNTEEDPDTFLCPLPGCDDESGHFKIWIKGSKAWCYCVKCGRPEKDERNLYYTVAKLEGISYKEVCRKFGIGRGDDWKLEDDIENMGMPEEPMDFEAVLAGLEAPIAKPQEPKLVVHNPEVAKPKHNVKVVKRIYSSAGVPPDPAHLKLWDEWFIDILDPQTLMGRQVQAYLRSRKVTAEMVKKYHMRYADSIQGGYHNSRYHGRVVIPVFNEGKLVFFQGRTILPIVKVDNEKYDSPWVPSPEKRQAWMHPWKHAGEVLFGYDLCHGCKSLAIVEGMFDAIFVGHQPGAYGGLSLLGKGLGDTRLAMIRQLAKEGAQEAILWPDNDVADHERNRLYEQLQAEIPTRWATIKDKNAGKDAAEVGHVEALRILDSAEVLGFEDLLGL